MKETSSDVPVLLLFFNRPEYAREVILSLINIKPTTIYIAFDGPRLNSLTDKEGIDTCFNLLKLVNWPCQIRTLKRESNLGCGLAVSQAITWFFTHEEMGIILEDDCVPTPAFFNYCEKMLYKFKDDDQIMHISGTRWHEEFPIDTSYFFTSVGHIWGWATWQRAWKKYDYQITNWPVIKESGLLHRLFKNKKHVWYWETSFDDVHYAEQKHTWDYQWQYALFINEGLAITPRRNLVQNIGIEGVHDNRFDSHKHNRVVATDFKIVNEEVIAERNSRFDNYNMDHHFLHKGPLWVRIKKRIQTIYKAIA